MICISSLLVSHLVIYGSKLKYYIFQLKRFTLVTGHWLLRIFDSYLSIWCELPWAFSNRQIDVISWTNVFDMDCAIFFLNVVNIILNPFFRMGLSRCAKCLVTTLLYFMSDLDHYLFSLEFTYQVFCMAKFIWLWDFITCNALDIVWMV